MYHQQSRTAGTAATRFRPPLAFDFEAQLASLARRLLSSAIGISPADRQFLQDLSRSENRYPMRTLRRLNRIAASSVQFEDREGPAELVRSDILLQTNRVGCLYTMHDAETLANNAFDLAQFQLERAYRAKALSLPVIEQYEHAGIQQLANTREAIDFAARLKKQLT